MFCVALSNLDVQITNFTRILQIDFVFLFRRQYKWKLLVNYQREVDQSDFSSVSPLLEQTTNGNCPRFELASITVEIGESCKHALK